MGNGSIHRHSTSTSIVTPSSTQVDAGRDLAFKVKVACPSGCDLQGGRVRIADDSGAITKAIELTSFDGTPNETAEIVLPVPDNPGEYLWNVLFEGEEPTDLAPDGVTHEGSWAALPFVVKAHTTSMAVWDVPSLILLNEGFSIVAGVQCSAECDLAGQVIEVYDHEQARVAMAALGSAPLSGTAALHWAQVELQAPSAEGYYDWTVRFLKPGLALDHEQASHAFAFRTVRPPEHIVTVVVVDKVEGHPIANAQVIMHPFRGFSDERGIARIGVTKGEYELWIPRGERYRKFLTTVHVSGDLELKAELVLIPEDPS